MSTPRIVLETNVFFGPMHESSFERHFLAPLPKFAYDSHAHALVLVLPPPATPPQTSCFRKGGCWWNRAVPRVFIFFCIEYLSGREFIISRAVISLRTSCRIYLVSEWSDFEKYKPQARAFASRTIGFLAPRLAEEEAIPRYSQLLTSFNLLTRPCKGLVAR